MREKWRLSRCEMCVCVCVTILMRCMDQSSAQLPHAPPARSTSLRSTGMSLAAPAAAPAKHSISANEHVVVCVTLQHDEKCIDVC